MWNIFREFLQISSIFTCPENNRGTGRDGAAPVWKNDQTGNHAYVVRESWKTIYVGLKKYEAKNKK